MKLPGDIQSRNMQRMIQDDELVDDSCCNEGVTI